MIKIIEDDLLKWWHNRQAVWEDKVDIAWLIQRVEDWYYKTRKVKYNIEVFNLATDNFECNDLFQFLVHYKLVENSDLQYPIIINKKWQVVDWRHRICKAILLWHKTIEAVQIMDDNII